MSLRTDGFRLIVRLCICCVLAVGTATSVKADEDLQQSQEHHFSLLFVPTSALVSIAYESSAQVPSYFSVRDLEHSSNESASVTAADAPTTLYSEAQLLARVDSLTESDTLSPSEFSYAGHLRYTIDGSAPLRNSKLNSLTLGITSAAYVGLMVGLHFYQMNTFWADRSSVFTVREDGNYAKDVDKFGHFYGATMVSYFSTEVLQGSGASVESARIWGTLMGLLYQTYVEVEDGYGKNWGFSPTDMYGNVCGASWYLLQFYVPVLQNITEKWMYTPPNWIHESGRKEGQTFIDDYSSNTFYFSFKMHNLLPQSWRSSWPKWLCLAGGYAARGLDQPDEDRKLIIALDYDLPELLPDFSQTVGGTFGAVLNWFKQSFNYFKLPSPAIEIGEHGMTRFNLLYPFKLKIGSLRF